MASVTSRTPSRGSTAAGRARKTRRRATSADAVRPPAAATPASIPPAVRAARASAPDNPPWQQFVQWATTSPQYAQLLMQYNSKLARLWQHAVQPALVATPAEPTKTSDWRFNSPEWNATPAARFARDSYLATAEFLNAAAGAAEIDPKSKGQVRFLIRQYVDAIAPSNFVATNPEVLKLAADSQGETLKRGVTNLVEDMAKGYISTVDERAFELGKNLAITPGAVVFENELMQLIQYRPTTDTVFERPLLMVPPCINKFYVLDLQPENSLIRYAVEQGHTVFVMSWRNPGPELAQLDWEDYIRMGPLTAIEVVRAISGQKQFDTLGFCVGGTILSTALAVLAARGDHPASSVTLFATLLDFSESGEIGCFVDEANVVAREATLAAGGLLSGRELATVFSALRGNDLVWPYVVNNYLKGGKPAAFDILYWNADSTNLPGPMFTWYVRNFYLENRLREPGAITVCGEPVDLHRIGAPAYIVATREDHIVPWRTAYASTRLLDHAPRFILGASGHIAGIINPASKNRRSFWSVDRAANTLPADPDQWYAAAVEHAGSWWTDWMTWLARHSGRRVPAPKALGSREHRPIEDAPGRYVKQRLA